MKLKLPIVIVWYILSPNLPQAREFAILEILLKLHVVLLTSHAPRES